MMLIVVIDVEQSVVPSCCSASLYALYSLFDVTAVDRPTPLDPVVSNSLCSAHVFFICLLVFLGGRHVNRHGTDVSLAVRVPPQHPLPGGIHQE